MIRILLVALMLCALPAHADERILSYDSDITVFSNGSQSVVETLRVRAEGIDIKRGIYRDFPTEYRTASGSRIRVDFRISSIERDGNTEAFHTQRLSNGVRVYIGSANVLLKPGEYTYRLSYVTDRQLGFFDEHDELYWNVTGNGWMFPIDAVTANVQLPPGVPSGTITAEAYTGEQGAQGKDFRAESGLGGAQFSTTRKLGPEEGLTIVVGWPKGHVHEPTWEDRLRWQWNDDPGLFVVWIGALVLFLYYLWAWRQVGRDPPAGVIVPEYEAPAGYPPAALRLVRRMGWDDKALSAALVGLAVKGALKIAEDDNGYRVTPTGKVPAQPSGDEQAILASLGAGTLIFESTNHSAVSALRSAHRSQLQALYEKSHYYSNRSWMVPGWILTVLIAAVAVYGVFNNYGPEAAAPLFITVFIGAFGSPFFSLLWRMREPAARTAANVVGLVVSGLMFLFVLTMFGTFILGEMVVAPWAMIVGLLVLAALNLLFSHWMKAPTKVGRKLLDHAEGFRQYLSVAESDELRFKYSKPVTPEIFEAYLPYAIALDVETQWGERFAAHLKTTGQVPANYRTSWYDGHSFSGVRGLSTSLGGGLAATVSSSSHAPGSSSGGSSGGGGGGSSGGGGGGGGGGGW